MTAKELIAMLRDMLADEGNYVRWLLDDDEAVALVKQFEWDIAHATSISVVAYPPDLEQRIRDGLLAWWNENYIEGWDAVHSDTLDSQATHIARYLRGEDDA